MERVGVSKLWSFLDGSAAAELVTSGQVRSGRGFRVGSYPELAARVAELQYRNRHHVLLYRGQERDWRSVRGFTTLKPTIFRPPDGRKTLPDQLVEERYETLRLAEQRLAEGFEALRALGRQRVARERLLRWAILQHYEVCGTPLLDVTHSLRIAASFASLSVGTSLSADDEACLLVLAVPHLSGAITASAEGGLQIVRLASVCPPSAMRPHLQEGYLLGEYPEMIGLSQKQHYRPFEMDFGRRIVAKFRFEPRAFWGDPAFPCVPREALYPATGDWLEGLAAGIREGLGR
ncbi:FRG domain-containing protein [Muricoccus roseus]|uniref:FRG domain-containing protein n=1 Tax=Muricoccus roseus TaxID=198092 RepID=UPI000934A4DF|nr:FRG domain-containing protein [Roseomonas rosea]